MGQVFFRIKPFSATGLARAYGMVAGTLLPGLAFAGPGGGQVIAGQAGITTPDAHTTVIRQQSQNAVINWQQFSVGSNEFVLFNQPSASAAVLNRVVGGLPSEILGNLSANGRVFLVNPQGVLFGEGARVDVGGLVASTLDIRKQDFMNGRYRFVQGTASPAEVANEGRIKTGPGGFVVLAADRVENSGLIQANGGDVLLASGSRMTLTMDADGLVGYSIDAAALSGQAGIDNVGDIVANGGTVVLDASVAQGLIGNVINNRGRITARSVEERDGAIYLLAEGGDIENSGSLDASGIAAADGGRVVLRTDQNLSLTDSGVIRADGGRSGDGGMIRLIAEGDAHTAAGSLISAHAGARGERGGAVELSGHASLSVRGAVDVGRGGRLLIDPSVVNIADGAGASSSTGGVATVFEQFIEGQLQSGADVAIVADDRITLESLVDGTLDGRNAGLGGSLTVGIGIVSGSGSTANGVFVDGPPPIGFSFFPGPGGSSAGGIFF
ncbi:MAG TPA: filamentous hemagglutinin N-terminal domain-containing protein, partial [Solimonas sp.]|nr:filamentous hemagglutinin N-terminal domain-containing protein [Solimonas sp.]